MAWMYFLYCSGDEELGRDFTYIDDIIAGILSTMDYNPDCCGVVFNLGFGHSVSVPELITILEEELGQNAELVGTRCNTRRHTHTKFQGLYRPMKPLDFI